MTPPTPKTIDQQPLRPTLNGRTSSSIRQKSTPFYLTSGVPLTPSCTTPTRTPFSTSTSSQPLFMTCSQTTAPPSARSSTCRSIVGIHTPRPTRACGRLRHVDIKQGDSSSMLCGTSLTRRLQAWLLQISMVRPTWADIPSVQIQRPS